METSSDPFKLYNRKTVRMINIHLFLIAIGLLIINVTFIRTDLMVESTYIDEITDINLRYLSMKNAKNATIDFRPYQEQIKSLVSFMLCVLEEIHSFYPH